LESEAGALVGSAATAFPGFPGHSYESRFIHFATQHRRLPDIVLHCRADQPMNRRSDKTISPLRRLRQLRK
jgi:hypothetical protein